MARVVNKTKGFSSISRDCVFDSEISDRARFIYVYMACKPEGWEFFQDKMAEELGIKKDTLRKYLDELIIRGWLTELEQENEGRFGSLEYVIEIKRKDNNLPIRKKTDTEKTRIGKNHNHINIDNISSKQCLSDIKEIENKKRLSNDNQKMPDELFISFWEKYGYKRGKKDAVAAWKKLSKQDKEEAIKAIPVYKEDCRVCDRQMRQPSVYLNKRTWEDDFTNNGKLSKEEQTEESGIVYPDGMDEQKWTNTTYWLCSNCRKIAGKISPMEFVDYKKRCGGDSKLLSCMLKEINSYVELHGQVDISEKLDELLRNHNDNEQETGD